MPAPLVRQRRRKPADSQQSSAEALARAPHQRAAPSLASFSRIPGMGTKSPVFPVIWMWRAAARQCRMLRHLGGGTLPALVLLIGCTGAEAPRGVSVVTAPAPSGSERYCAWYADREGDLLYVGEAPFWSAMRASGGDPTADLATAGPRPIGRFDLAAERWLPPLDATREGSRSGVWDVHVHRDGQVYFTSFYEPGGRIDPRSGDVTHFDAAGPGLNELAPGPGDRVLVSRYGAGADHASDGGELLTLDPAGEVAHRWPLPAPAGYRVAPKTPAWNPVRRRLVATTDLIPRDGGELRHDAFQLDAEGAAWERSRDPELQFVAATADGTEYRVEAHAGGGLWLRRIDPPGASRGERQVLLDPRFPAAVDFAQDLKFAADGRAVVTRWSGVVHVVDASGAVATLRLPRLDPDGLYYTAVIRGNRVCATHCADVTVVCADSP